MCSLLIQWYSTSGACRDSSVAVCCTDPGNKVLWTQNINKSLPAPDEYPVRVFVKLHVTYPFLNCSEERECDGDLKLQIKCLLTVVKHSLSEVMSSETTIQLLKTLYIQFYFDLSTEVT